jgi:hypothetical protein
MILIAAVIVAGAYMGHISGKKMAGTDGTVEAYAAPGSVSDSIGARLMKRLGEPLGFALVGITGGLVAGFYWNRWRKN